MSRKNWLLTSAILFEGMTLLVGLRTMAAYIQAGRFRELWVMDDTSEPLFKVVHGLAFLIVAWVLVTRPKHGDRQ